MSIKDFVIGNLVGKGGFGKVYAAKERKDVNQDCAIKVMNRIWLKEKRLLRRVAQEIKLHRKLNHPNIVKLFSYFEDKSYIYLVMELCAGGNLYQHVRNKPAQATATVKRWFKEVTLAVCYLHENDIVHRDIKLSNVLLSEDGSVKLADFGLAARIESQEHHTICGTPNYMAPEVRIHDKTGSSYDPIQADLWSLGCLLYALFHAGKPLQQKTSYKRTCKIVDDSCDEILSILLNPISDRSSASAVLKHSFLKESNQEETQRLSFVRINTGRVRGVEHSFGSYTVRISNQGQIQVTDTERSRNIVVTEWMPQQYEKLQRFASKAVDILRSETPKVVLRANTPEPMVAAVVEGIGRVWFENRGIRAYYDVDAEDPVVQVGGQRYDLRTSENEVARLTQMLTQRCLQIEVDIYRLYSGQSLMIPVIINEDQVAIAGVGTGMRLSTGEVQVRLEDGTFISLDKSASTVTVSNQSFLLMKTNENMHLPSLPAKYRSKVGRARNVLKQLAS